MTVGGGRGLISSKSCIATSRTWVAVQLIRGGLMARRRAVGGGGI